MYSLITHSHLFTLSDVVKEHRARGSPYVPVLGDAGEETPESKVIGHTSDASVALHIDDALEKFSRLSLTSYPDENVKGLATEALRLIKIMEGGYCLPLKLGSDLLKKVYTTSCEHFN